MIVGESSRVLIIINAINRIENIIKLKQNLYFCF